MDMMLKPALHTYESQDAKKGNDGGGDEPDDDWKCQKNYSIPIAEKNQIMFCAFQFTKYVLLLLLLYLF